MSNQTVATPEAATDASAAVRNEADPEMTSSASAGLSAKTRGLLDKPVLPTLLRLAAPNFGEAVARVLFVSIDAIFVSWLGSDALAALAIVFPLFIVMQTISAAGIGSGVNAAIARALGAGLSDQAGKIAGAATGLAIVIGIATTVLMLVFGPAIYAAMGASGAVLTQAQSYGAIVFGGGIVVWLMNTFANVARAQGSMTVSAGAIVAGEVVHLTLSPILVLGWGPIPSLGVVGAGIAVIASYLTGLLVLVAFLRSSRAIVNIRLTDIGMGAQSLKAILRIGLFATLVALLFQVSNVVLTVIMGSLGAAGLAAYTAASRLELMQLPITFALGSAIVTMISTAEGAGLAGRSRRVAWIGAGAGAARGCCFLVVAMFGDHWMKLFTNDPQIIAIGSHYLACQAATLPCFGLGLCLYYALQGAGQVLLPALIGCLRLLIVGGGGWLAMSLTGGNLTVLFVVVASGTACFGLCLLFVAYRRFNTSGRRVG